MPCWSSLELKRIARSVTGCRRWEHSDRLLQQSALGGTRAWKPLGSRKALSFRRQSFKVKVSSARLKRFDETVPVGEWDGLYRVRFRSGWEGGKSTRHSDEEWHRKHGPDKNEATFTFCSSTRGVRFQAGGPLWRGLFWTGRSGWSLKMRGNASDHLQLENSSGHECSSMGKLCSLR